MKKIFIILQESGTHKKRGWRLEVGKKKNIKLRKAIKEGHYLNFLIFKVEMCPGFFTR